MTLTRESIRHELRRRDAAVASVRPLTPALVRITLAGPDLDGFRADGPADHIRLAFPTGETRDYTPRAARPGELDVDFVLHGDEGPATRWARAAHPGDRIGVGGPRGSRLAPAGLTRLVIVADATALPAAARWIEATPVDVPITALLRVDESDAPYLDADRADVRLVAGDAALLPALRDAADPHDDRTFFFLAGEATALVPLRRHLRHDLALGPDQLQASGYWRRGVAGLDHHAPIDPTDPD